VQPVPGSASGTASVSKQIPGVRVYPLYSGPPGSTVVVVDVAEVLSSSVSAVVNIGISTSRALPAVTVSVITATIRSDKAPDRIVYVYKESRLAYAYLENRQVAVANEDRITVVERVA
jgi:hypothetical protein